MHKIALKIITYILIITFPAENVVWAGDVSMCSGKASTLAPRSAFASKSDIEVVVKERLKFIPRETILNSRGEGFMDIVRKWQIESDAHVAYILTCPNIDTWDFINEEEETIAEEYAKMSFKELEKLLFETIVPKADRQNWAKGVSTLQGFIDLISDNHSLFYHYIGTYWANGEAFWVGNEPRVLIDISIRRALIKNKCLLREIFYRWSLSNIIVPVKSGSAQAYQSAKTVAIYQLGNIPVVDSIRPAENFIFFDNEEERQLLVSAAKNIADYIERSGIKVIIPNGYSGIVAAYLVVLYMKENGYRNIPKIELGELYNLSEEFRKGFKKYRIYDRFKQRQNLTEYYSFVESLKHKAQFVEGLDLEGVLFLDENVCTGQGVSATNSFVTDLLGLYPDDVRTAGLVYSGELSLEERKMLKINDTYAEGSYDIWKEMYFDNLNGQNLIIGKAVKHLYKKLHRDVPNWRFSEDVLIRDRHIAKDDPMYGELLLKEWEPMWGELRLLVQQEAKSIAGKYAKHREKINPKLKSWLEQNKTGTKVIDYYYEDGKWAPYKVNYMEDYKYQVNDKGEGLIDDQYQLSDEEQGRLNQTLRSCTYDELGKPVRFRIVLGETSAAWLGDIDHSSLVHVGQRTLTVWFGEGLFRDLLKKGEDSLRDRIFRHEKKHLLRKRRVDKGRKYKALVKKVRKKCEEIEKGVSVPIDEMWEKIKAVDGEPNKNNEIQLLNIVKHNFMVTRRVKFRGKVYYAKYISEGYVNLEDSCVLAQAAILKYLNDMKVQNICRAVHFIELDNGTKAILFEKFPQGEILQDKINRRRMSEEETIGIMLKVLAVFKQLHEAGVYHWDIKPDNILITDEGGVIVFDFDFTFRTEEEFVDRELAGVGTSLYKSKRRRNGIMPRNQYGKFSPSEDEVYSLAITMLEMLSQQTLSSYIDLQGSISKSLKGILHRACDNGECQYKTVDEFIGALETCRTPEQASKVEADRIPVKRNLMAGYVAAMVIAVIGSIEGYKVLYIAAAGLFVISVIFDYLFKDRKGDRKGDGSVSSAQGRDAGKSVEKTAADPIYRDRKKGFPAGRHDSKMPKLEEIQWTGQEVTLDKNTIADLVSCFNAGTFNASKIFSTRNMLFKAEDDESTSLRILLELSLSNLMLKIRENKQLAGIFFNQILGTQVNAGRDICIRVARDMPVNSARYYDRDKNLVIIVLDSDFINALLEHAGDRKYIYTVEWLLTERVFIHEFSHDNTAGSEEEEIQEETDTIQNRDLIFYKELCFSDKHLRRSIEAFRKIPGISEATKSGEYFNLLKELCYLISTMDLSEQSIIDRIREYVFNTFYLEGPEVDKMITLQEKFRGIPDEYLLILNCVNKLEKEFKPLNDAEIADRVKTLKERLAGRPITHEVMSEALAIFREAAARTLDIRPYDEQILGAIAVVRGKAVEMLTGEGKTLAIAMAGFVNSLFGRGVHIATFNDYLAKRDTLWMGKIFDLLGVSVGLRLDKTHSYLYSKRRYGNRLNLKSVSKKRVYLADVTYGSSNIFVFDSEEDSIATNIAERVQRELSYAIVDEGDSILVDEAFIPLSLSAQVKKDTKKSLYKVANDLRGDSRVLQYGFSSKQGFHWRKDKTIYYAMAEFVKDLIKGMDYTVDVKNRSILANMSVLLKFAKYKTLRQRYKNVPDIVFENCLIQALKSRELVHLDEDYMIEDGRLVIIDEFTGRPRYGYIWDSGLHQAVEAKEGLADITDFSKSLASTTKYRYFKKYKQFSCASGTIRGVREILLKLYKLEAIEIPPNKSVRREEYPLLHFKTRNEKFNAIVREVREKREGGRPVLIGTRTIKDSELLSRLLASEEIPHRVLNGKNLEKEAEIVAQAGRAPDGKGNITIVTNLAGRGTDIRLGEGVNEKGGLHVIGVECHESIRVDNQLRGRASRQGDNGSSRFFSSEEDHIVRRFRDKGNPDEPLDSILKRSWGTVKRSLLFKSRLDNIYSFYQKRFYWFRDVLLRRGVLTNKDVIDISYSLRDDVDTGKCYEEAKEILDYILGMEAAVFVQEIKKKELIKNKKDGDKKNLLKIVDLNYEIFIFRMQALMERLSRIDIDEAELELLFTKASQWIFYKFMEGVEQDMREIEMKNGIGSADKDAELRGLLTSV